MNELLLECEKEFERITIALKYCDYKLANTLAWRMQTRLEEARLKHPG